MATARAELTPDEWDWLVSVVDEQPREVKKARYRAVRELRRAQAAARQSFKNEMAERARIAAKHPQDPDNQ